MSSVPANQPLVPSVLDRLIDREPGNTREVAKQRYQVLREMKQSVRRDLENLLNTRLRSRRWPLEFDELKQSLVAYGMPDLAGASLASDDARREFLREVEDTIIRFEPRFLSVSISPLDVTDRLDRSLRFRIDAQLRCEPAPEPVTYESSFEPTSGNVTVKGAGA